MAIEEYTVQNTAPVGQVNDAMDPGAVEKLKIEALATVQTVQVETARVSEGERQLQSSSPAPSSGGGGGSNPEAKVYGDIMMDALGLKTISTAVELIGDRMDAAKGGMAAGQAKGVISKDARTFDDFVMGKGSAHKRDIIGDANLASSSLNGQGKDAIGTWAVKEQKMGGVALAKQLTMTNDIASRKTLDQAMVYQANHGAAMSMAMGLGSGPRYNSSPQEVHRVAKDYTERGDGTWS